MGPPALFHTLWDDSVQLWTSQPKGHRAWTQFNREKKRRRRRKERKKGRKEGRKGMNQRETVENRARRIEESWSSQPGVGRGGGPPPGPE